MKPRHRTPCRVLIISAAAALALSGCVTSKPQGPVVSKAPAPQAAGQNTPLVAYDYQEGRFGAAQQKANGYCADAYNRQATAVGMDRENKVATFACDAPL
jgi:hypothetical protein